MGVAVKQITIFFDKIMVKNKSLVGFFMESQNKDEMPKEKRIRMIEKLTILFVLDLHDQIYKISAGPYFL